MGFELTWYELCALYLVAAILGPFYIGQQLYYFFARETRLAFRSSRTHLVPVHRMIFPWTTFMQKKREQRNEAQNPLMRLPGELRNRIYELSMPTNCMIAPLCYYHLVSPCERSQKELGLRVLKTAEAYGHSQAEHWSRIANISQVCRALRGEALGHVYEKNSFAFHRGRYYYDRRASKYIPNRTIDLQRARPMFLEHWLQSRPTKCPPNLKVILQSTWSCPRSHRDEILRVHNIGRFDSAGQVVHFSMTGNYLIMLDFAMSRDLKLVKATRPQEHYMVLHDCRVCLGSVQSAWKKLTMSGEWRSARDNWYDKLDTGELEWKDALRMIDLIRDYQW